MAKKHLEEVDEKLKEIRAPAGVKGFTPIFWEMGGKKIFKIISKFIKPRDHVLDVGCGGAQFLKEFAPSVQLCLGIDPILETSLHLAKRNLKGIPNVFIILSTGENLPLRENDWDLILCLSTLQHVYDEKQVLKSIRYIAKNKSKIIIQVPLSSSQEIAKGYARNFDYHSIQEILKNSGFSIIKKIPYGFFPSPIGKLLHFISRISKSLTRFLIRLTNFFLIFFPKSASTIIIVSSIEKNKI